MEQQVIELGSQEVFPSPPVSRQRLFRRAEMFGGGADRAAFCHADSVGVFCHAEGVAEMFSWVRFGTQIPTFDRAERYIFGNR